MRVVLFLLKCVVGLFATIGFLVVVGAAGLALTIGLTGPWKAIDTEPEIPDNAVLSLDLSAGVIEVLPDNPLSRASLSDAISIRGSLDALEAAGRLDAKNYRTTGSKLAETTCYRQSGSMDSWTHEWRRRCWWNLSGNGKCHHGIDRTGL